jgi:hypothetical protein
MASRHFLFAEAGVGFPPPRRPSTASPIPPGLPPADGQDPPEVCVSDPFLDLLEKLMILFIHVFIGLLELHNHGFRSPC